MSAQFNELLGNHGFFPFKYVILGCKTHFYNIVGKCFAYILKYVTNTFCETFSQFENHQQNTENIANEVAPMLGLVKMVPIKW